MRDVSAPASASFRVLTVCTGNLHRSPLAEGLLTARLGGAFVVGSAGTHATVGDPMDPVAATLLKELGGSRPEGAARRLTAELVEQADLVLGAATEHRDAAVRLAPVRALRRAFTLREFARLVRPEDAAGLACPAERAAALVEGAALRRAPAPGGPEDDDVADPYGAPEAVARAAARLVADAVELIAAAVLGHPPAGSAPAPATAGRAARPDGP
jgi:protein-tyrosine phosphatase